MPTLGIKMDKLFFCQYIAKNFYPGESDFYFVMVRNRYSITRICML